MKMNWISPGSGRAALILAAALPLLSFSGRASAEEAVASTKAAPAPPSALDRRVQLLTKELNLDSQQRVVLRQILEGQRDSVLRIWADPNLLPAERAAMTRSVQEQAGDHIRAMLNDEQKKKYNPPNPHGPVTAHESTPDVEGWLKVVRAPRSDE